MCNPSLSLGGPKYFFLGIGGIGMSALAEYLHQLGESVAGSDAAESEALLRLRQKGILVEVGHSLAFFEAFSPTILVFTSAVSMSHPLYQKAIERGIPCIRRGKLLADCLNAREGLVVAGSHGKTTTASLLTFLLRAGGHDPSFAIGGRLADTHENSALGTGPCFVAEGDESDASFLELRPKIIGLTNLDQDHMGTYEYSFDTLKQRFLTWILALPEGGGLVLNQDDPELNGLIESIPQHFWERRTLLRLGLKPSPEANVELLESQTQARWTFFNVRWGNAQYSGKIPMIGAFNVGNALLAATMATLVGQSFEKSLALLAHYPGVKRRLEWLGEYQHLPVFEDYGHHPTELLASIQALKKAYPDRRLVQVFQLHRYTRTRDLWVDFIAALSHSKILILFPIYPASETPIPGITAEKMAEELALHSGVSSQVYYAHSLEAARTLLKKILNPSDLLLLQGAGDLPARLWIEMQASAAILPLNQVQKEH